MSPSMQQLLAVISGSAVGWFGYVLGRPRHRPAAHARDWPPAVGCEPNPHPHLDTGPWSGRRRPASVRPWSGRLVLAGGALGLVVGLVWASATVVVVAPLLAAVAHRELARFHRQARQRRELEALPVQIDAVIQHLRSGRTLAWAGAEVFGPDPVSAPASGRDVPASGHDGPVIEARGLVEATVSSLLAVGGPAADGLRRLRYTLVGFVQAERRARVEATQAVASAALLCIAPLLFAVLAALVEADLARFYLHHRAGLVCVVIALLLVVGGWEWMMRIIERSRGTPSSQPPRIALPATRRRHRDAALAARLPAVVDLLAVCLGAGRSLAAALNEVAERGPALARPGFVAVLDRAHRGHTMADALPLLSEQLGSAYQPLTTALIVSEQGGAPLAVLLQRLADDAESARRFRLDVVARRLPVALLPPLTVCMLPAIIIGTLVPLAVVSFAGFGTTAPP